MLTVPVSLDARPRIVTGPEPQSKTIALPPLAKDTVSDGFRIELDGQVDYGTAARTLTAALAGRRFTRAGRTVAVDNVMVFPAPRGRLLLAIGFAGDATGRLQLVGTPRYQPAVGTVDVPDLDFDLQYTVTGGRFVAWKGNVFVGSMMEGRTKWTGHIRRITFSDDGQPIQREPILRELRQRIRDVRMGPDELLYVLTDQNPGVMLRIEPAE